MFLLGQPLNNCIVSSFIIRHSWQNAAIYGIRMKGKDITEQLNTGISDVILNSVVDQN